MTIQDSIIFKAIFYRILTPNTLILKRLFLLLQALCITLIINGSLFSESVYFLLPLPYYRKVMEVLFSVKIFDGEFSPDLYVLRSPESKKVVFENWSVRMYVCVCVCDSKVDI